MDAKNLMDSFEGRIMGGELHQGGYIHVPQKEAEQIIDLLKKQKERVEQICHYCQQVQKPVTECLKCGVVTGRLEDRYCG